MKIKWLEKLRRPNPKIRERFAWWAQLLANLATAVAVVFAAIEITNTRNERNLNTQLRAIELVTPRISIQWQYKGHETINFLHQASYSFETVVHNRTAIQSTIILDFQTCRDAHWGNENPPGMILLQEHNGTTSEELLRFSAEEGNSWLTANITLQPGKSKIEIHSINDPRDPEPFDNIPVALNGQLKSIKTDGGLSSLVGEVLKNTGMAEATWLLSIDKIIGQRVFNNLDAKQKKICRSPSRRHLL